MPLSDCEVLDPRIRRTRQLLQGALQILLQSKSFEDLSVQDITEAATVNRATFYDHYSDKFALAEALVAGGFHRLLRERQVGFDGTCAYAASAVIRATCDYLVQMCPADGECNRQIAFGPLADAAILAAIRRVLTGSVHTLPGDSSLSTEMAASAASWAIYGAAKHWFQTANRVPVDEILPQILNLTLPVLMRIVSAESTSLAATHA